MFMKQKMWPVRVRKNLKWSFRVGESSIFNILNHIKLHNNMGSRLLFFKDVLCENDVFNNILYSFFINFESILGRSEGPRRLPGTAWSQTGTTEHPGVAPGAPWDPTWRLKTIKNHWKTRFFIKSKKKVFSFQTREQLENWAVMLVKLLFSRISLPKKGESSNFQNNLNGALV